MNEKETILKWIRQVVSENGNPRTEESYEDHTQLLQEGIIDSTGLLGIIGEIEEEYGIDIPDEDMSIKYFGSIKSITDYVYTSLKKAA